MNNSKNKQNIKFKKQLNHISSFVGMPMWNGRNPTLSEIREYDRLLIEKQVQDIEPKKQSVWGRLIKLLKNTGSKNPSDDAKARTQKNEKKDYVIISPECCS